MKVAAVGVVLLVAMVTVEARGPPFRANSCEYAKGNWSDCDPETQTVTRELTLTNEEPDCEEFINQTISCQRYERFLAWKERKQEKNERRQQLERCNYEKSEWSECDLSTNTTSKVFTLIEGDQDCEETHNITISCDRLEEIMERKTRKMERKMANAARKEQRQLMRELKLKCKYDKGEWSACNETSQTVSRVLTLREAEEGCEETVDVTIPCDRLQQIEERKAKKTEMKNARRGQKQQRKQEMRQMREKWLLVRAQKKLGCDFDVSFSDCDTANNTVTKTYTPDAGADATCESMSFTYSCELHERLMERKSRRQEKQRGRNNKMGPKRNGKKF